MQTNEKSLTEKQREALAIRLIKYLVRKNLFYDVIIYINNQRWFSDEYKNATPKQITDKITVYVQDNIDVKEYIEYSNPDTITVTYEGPLYDVLTYGSNKTEKEINAILDKYGLYLEYGYAWSFSAYF
jgi:hypothetical protein